MVSSASAAERALRAELAKGLASVRTALLALSAIISPAAAAATAINSTAVDRYIVSEMHAQQIPGLSLAVASRGRLVYVKSYGVATLEHPVRVKPDTLFQIGSIGKQFTATAMMLLARAGRIDLDDPLSKYLAQIPAGWKGVTLRLMLNHQSGIPQLTPPAHNLLDLHHDYTDDEYVRLATSLPLDFEPGTDVSYSDTAYVLLGIVINQVSRQFYGDYLDERVFKPLRMKRTRIISDSDIIVDRASGYEKGASGTLQNQAWVAPALNRTADGSLYSTVLDLARWDQALYDGRVLTAAELRQMWTVDQLRGGEQPLYHYGYGWEINSLRGHRVIEYDGNWQGFQAAMARYDDRELTVIVLTNLSLCRAQRIAHTVAGYFDPELAHFRSNQRDSNAELTREFRHFIDEVQRGTLEASVRQRAEASWRSPTWMRALARDFTATGPVRSTNFAEERTVRGVLERVYRVETAQMVDYFTVRYGQQGAMEDVELYQEF